MLSTFQKRLLSATGIFILLIGLLFAAPKIGLYFGSGNSIINDSIEFTIKCFSDQEYKIILCTLPLPKSITKEEIEVYKTVLPDIEWIPLNQIPSQDSSPSDEQRAKTAKIVLLDTTSWEPRFEWDSLFHLIWRYGHPAMMIDFVRKNALAPRKHILHKLSPDLYCASSAELEQAFSTGLNHHDFGLNFHATFPMARCNCTVSRVGFDWDRKTAFVCVGCQSAPLAGAGFYYILKKDIGCWKILSSSCAWVS